MFVCGFGFVYRSGVMGLDIEVGFVLGEWYFFGFRDISVLLVWFSFGVCGRYKFSVFL